MRGSSRGTPWPGWHSSTDWALGTGHDDDAIILKKIKKNIIELSTLKMAKKNFFFFFPTFFFQSSSMEIGLLEWKYHYMDDFRKDLNFSLCVFVDLSENLNPPEIVHLMVFPY